MFGFTALVVENNPVVLRAVSAILAQEGGTVTTAANGLEALEKLQDLSPDLLFTDLIMPQVSGEQLCRIVKNSKKHRDVFVVVLSGILLEDRERILREVDCDFCIAKGELTELRKHIKEALAGRQLRLTGSPGKRFKESRIPDGLEPSEVASELLLAKDHLSVILSTLEEGLLELNSQGIVLAANRAALQMLDLDEAQVIGQTLESLAVWAGRYEEVKAWLAGELRKGPGKCLEITENEALLTNGKTITASLMVVNERGSRFGLCILRDITRQYLAEKNSRELDEAIKFARKMDAMSCMAGGFAHDFNNLLTVICGNLEIVTQFGDRYDESGKRHLLEQASKAAMVAVDLTRRISFFSNYGVISRANVDLRSLLTDVAKICASGGDFETHIAPQTGACLVHADQQDLLLAIENVIRNGWEASNGGRVTLTLSRLELAQPQLLCGQYLSAGSYVRLDISDQGKGIDQEHLLRVFDPYFSTKERGVSKGMGLGLTIVYATVRNHGGYVLVDSQKLVGTTVSIILPRHEAEVKALEKTSKQPVILMDRDRQMRLLAKEMLEHLGSPVFLAQDIQELLQVLRDLTNETIKPVLFLDSGGETAEQVRMTCQEVHTKWPEARIVLLTSVALDSLVEDCRKYGVVNALIKPFNAESLKHVLASLPR